MDLFGKIKSGFSLFIDLFIWNSSSMSTGEDS